ncbi:hypothetical protein N8824_01585 [Candidatus Pelagibacter sp.]|nr:hypothetical protein [Candidatus Pelagibacter sp.]
MAIVIGIYPSPYDCHPHSHDFNCAIVTNNNLYAYEEKKLFGYKFDEGTAFPFRSLLAGLRELEIKPKDVDKWVFTCPTNLLPKIMLEQLFCDKLKACNSENLSSFIKKKISFLPHHNAHMAMAKFTSGHKDTYVLSIDGGGDGYDHRNLVLGKFTNEKLKILVSSKNNTGLAGFHAILTDTLGFGVDNGKTSGFASYGNLNMNLYKKLEKFITDKKFRNPYFKCSRQKSEVNLKDISFQNFALHKYLNTSPSNNEMLKITKNYFSADVAITGEQLIKDKLTNFLKFNIKNQKKSNLVCVGGLFHNVAINQHLIENSNFDNIFFSMSAGDGGLGLGLALNEYLKISKKKFHITHKKFISKFGLSPFLGPSFKNTEIEKLIKNTKNLKFKKLGNKSNNEIISRILKGDIVGIFRGRAEYGPRSLGNRSIIADPRKIESKIKINSLIKRRDWFMPFAPAVIKEKYLDYFKDKTQSLYMQTSPEGNDNFKKIAKAGVHVDGSSRVQLVDKKINKDFWELINIFGKKTKLYCLLNTSFNRHGISTIGHPQQAIDHLLNGSINTLILGDFIVELDITKDQKFLQNKKLLRSSEKKLLNIHENNYRKKLKKISIIR